MEYVFVLVIAMMVALALTRSITIGLNRGIASFGGWLEKDLRSGRVPPSVYVN